jgi:hypothetical protein
MRSAPLGSLSARTVVRKEGKHSSRVVRVHAMTGGIVWGSRIELSGVSGDFGNRRHNLLLVVLAIILVGQQIGAPARLTFFGKSVTSRRSLAGFEISNLAPALGALAVVASSGFYVRALVLWRLG